MKKLLYEIIIILLVANVAIAQHTVNYCSENKINSALSSDILSKLNYPGDSKIDVTYYKLDITVFPNEQMISGKVTIKSRSLEDGLSNFYYDLKDNMQVSGAFYNRLPVNVTHADNKVIFSPAQPIQSGEEIEVEIEYSGNPLTTGFGSFEFTTHEGANAVWTLSEPYGASDWWPCKDTPADKADSADIWITCPAALTPVSNGTLTGVIDNGNATHTYKWHSGYPISQYLISMAITNYKVYQNTFVYNNGLDTMYLTHYNYPENFNDQRIEELDRTVDMLEKFSEKFGLYPFVNEKYGHAEFSWRGGMEHQTITSIGVFYQDVIAHELAHQWFGDKITCKDWHHIWLNEGFATYCEAVYAEAAQGKSFYDNMILSDMVGAKRAAGSIYVQDISSVSEIFNGSRSYAKAGIVLHMLRGVLGDETFFKVMYNYANNENLAYSVATTEDFQQIAETTSGKDLDYFFEQWIYGENYPKYSAIWNFHSLSNNNYEVKINLSQSANSSPEFFTMPVDIKIKTKDQDTTISVWNDKQSQEFTINVKGEPIGLLIDPANKILKDVSIITNIDMDNIPKEFYVSQNYPNPFNPSTNILIHLPVDSEVKLIIYNAAGEAVLSKEEGLLSSGNHILNLDLRKESSILPSGVYIFAVKNINTTISRKMIYLK